MQDGLIAPTFVATHDMAADIFTKALDRSKVQNCAQTLGLFSKGFSALHIHGEVLFVCKAFIIM